VRHRSVGDPCRGRPVAHFACSDLLHFNLLTGTVQDDLLSVRCDGRWRNLDQLPGLVQQDRQSVRAHLCCSYGHHMEDAGALRNECLVA